MAQQLHKIRVTQNRSPNCSSPCRLKLKCLQSSLECYSLPVLGCSTGSLPEYKTASTAVAGLHATTPHGAAMTLTLPRRVRALSLPVSPCAVQVVRCFHRAQVFLTRCSATDGSQSRLRRPCQKKTASSCGIKGRGEEGEGCGSVIHCAFVAK